MFFTIFFNILPHLLVFVNVFVRTFNNAPGDKVSLSVNVFFVIILTATVKADET